MAEQVKSGIGTLPCPYCGEQGASIDLHLTDLTFTCGDCEVDFTVQEVRSILAQWAAVLAWIDLAPAPLPERDAP